MVDEEKSGEVEITTAIEMFDPVAAIKELNRMEGTYDSKNQPDQKIEFQVISSIPRPPRTRRENNPTHCLINKGKPIRVADV